MSLSPFDSFQSRFVTYLLNFPRITEIFCVQEKYIILSIVCWATYQCSLANRHRHFSV